MELPEILALAREHGYQMTSELGVSVNVFSFTPDELQSFAAAVERLRKDAKTYHPHGKQQDVCVWAQDSDGPWNTSCGQTFEFNEGTPAENHALFCHHCGGALLAEPYAIDAAISKELTEPKCEHGKSLDDYCEPCGRIHSA